MTELGYRYPAGNIIIFAKEPVAGKVKTRLASSIGDQAALQFHQQMLQQTLTMACNSCLAPVELHVSGNSDNPEILALAQQYGIYLQRSTAAIMASTVVSLVTLSALFVWLGVG